MYIGQGGGFGGRPDSRMERARGSGLSGVSAPSLGSWASDWQLLAQLILSWSPCSNADLITYCKKGGYKDDTRYHMQRA